MKKIILLALVAIVSINSEAAEKKPAARPAARPATAAARPMASSPAPSAPKRSFARKYGTAGCGLGNLVFGKDNQVLAATTNGSTYSQLFGITFGTLNCEGGNLFTTAENMDRFMITNKVAAADSIARGEGEVITTLASLMNCSAQEARLGSALQSEFKTIFPKHDVPAGEITDNILTVVGNDAALAQACNVQI